jgi:peptidoglycan/LPS O-acetylase OafA/YrhL
MDAFGFGMLAAVLHVNRLRLPRWVIPQEKWGRLGIAGMMLVGVAIYWLPGKRNEYWADNPIFYLWTPALVLGIAAIILAGVGGSRLVNRLFSNRFMIYAGLVSYSYYLWHLPVLRWIAETDWFRSLETMRFLSLLLVSTPLIFVISTLSYVLIELPGMRFRRKAARA